MAIRLHAANCPKCGQSIIGSVGPNYVPINAPAPLNWTVYMAMCTNMNCQAVLGTYALPNE